MNKADSTGISRDNSQQECEQRSFKERKTEHESLLEIVRENERLKMKNENLTVSYDKLAEKYKKLKIYNVKLKADNAELNGHLEEIIESEGLKTENQDLVQKLNQQESYIRKMEKEIKENKRLLKRHKKRVTNEELTQFAKPQKQINLSKKMFQTEMNWHSKGYKDELDSDSNCNKKAQYPRHIFTEGNIALNTFKTLNINSRNTMCKQSDSNRTEASKFNTMGKHKVEGQSTENCKTSKQKVEVLESGEERKLNWVIDYSKKEEMAHIEELSVYEKFHFIFEIKQMTSTQKCEVILLNKTIYKEHKDKLLSILLEKLFRNKELKKIVKEIIYLNNQYILIHKDIVDEFLDSDFSEYEDNEDLDKVNDINLPLNSNNQQNYNEQVYNKSRESFDPESFPNNNNYKTPKSMTPNKFEKKEFKIKNKNQYESQTNNKKRVYSHRKRGCSGERNPIHQKNLTYRKNDSHNFQRYKKNQSNLKNKDNSYGLRGSMHSHRPVVHPKEALSKEKFQLNFEKMHRTTNISEDDEEDNLCKSSFFESQGNQINRNYHPPQKIFKNETTSSDSSPNNLYIYIFLFI